MGFGEVMRMGFYCRPGGRSLLQSLDEVLNTVWPPYRRALFAPNVSRARED